MNKIKNLICKLVLCYLFFIACDTSSQWIFQSSGTTNHLYDIFFIDSKTGWACGNNSTIIKTTNGGLNWVNQIAGTYTGKPLYGIYFVSYNIGYIAGNFETILKTTNGGNNWQVIKDNLIGQGNSYWDIYFFNENTGWISGEIGTVLKTINGGLNWDSLISGSTGRLYNIKFLNINTGYVCGGYVRKTTDGGNSWQVQVIGTMATLSMDFINTETGWCVGEQDNKIFKTTNGGINWNLVNTLPGGNLQYSYCMKFTDSLKGWIGGTYGRIFSTTDGGLNWINEDHDSMGFVNNFSFYKDSLGWCSGGGGKIKKKTVFIGVQSISTEIPLEFSLYQNFPNPFNPITTIEFEISYKDLTILKVYDALGKEVQVLVNDELRPGKYQVNFDGSNLSSGIYFYSLFSNKLKISKKMILIK
jgi:photosystem II stability/assembly factor-like uncharacterized protein